MVPTNQEEMHSPHAINRNKPKAIQPFKLNKAFVGQISDDTSFNNLFITFRIERNNFNLFPIVYQRNIITFLILGVPIFAWRNLKTNHIIISNRIESPSCFLGPFLGDFFQFSLLKLSQHFSDSRPPKTQFDPPKRYNF